MKGALRDELGANMRSNPFIYTTVGGSKETVLFQNDGVIGSYNRANRSLAHMIENFGAVLAGLMLAGSCFPFPTFVCACAFGVGRIMHQVGTCQAQWVRALRAGDNTHAHCACARDAASSVPILSGESSRGSVSLASCTRWATRAATASTAWASWCQRSAPSHSRVCA